MLRVWLSPLPPGGAPWTLVAPPHLLATCAGLRQLSGAPQQSPGRLEENRSGCSPGGPGEQSSRFRALEPGGLWGAATPGLAAAYTCWFENKKHDLKQVPLRAKPGQSFLLPQMRSRSPQTRPRDHPPGKSRLPLRGAVLARRAQRCLTLTSTRQPGPGQTGCLRTGKGCGGGPRECAVACCGPSAFGSQEGPCAHRPH